MKLINETGWDTLDLKRFIMAGLRDLGADTKMIVKVTHRRGVIRFQKRDGSASLMARNGPVNGHAYFPGFKNRTDGHKIRLAVPNAKLLGGQPMTEAVLLALAQVLEHEIGHTLGHEHKDMPKWWKLEPRWHLGLSIRPKEKKA